MIRAVLDTNLLLYAANADAPENGAAVAFLTRAAASADAWYLTEGISYEFLRVSTHPAVFPRPLSAVEALSFLDALLEPERFRLLSASTRHWDVLRAVLADLHHPAGNLFFDLGCERLALEKCRRHPGSLLTQARNACDSLRIVRLASYPSPRSTGR